MKSYIFFFKHGPPQHFGSSTDLISSWREQIAKRSKTNEWYTPLEFKDEDGNVVIGCMAEELVSIIQGSPLEGAGK